MANLVSVERVSDDKIFTPAVLFFWSAIVLILSEFIGPVNIPVGKANIMLLPMIWALLFGAVAGILGKRQSSSFFIQREHQELASKLLQPALLFFTAKLGVVVGLKIPVILASGWALIFQEFGHFVGTIILGMPLALLLGIKRESIGATFSVGREPNLAVISERYGMNSPEGRGVMAEYITGTLLGALLISIVAGVMTSLNLFDPRSLAMATGVGSGSMMAAASGAIAAQVDAKTAGDVMALAAASNLITSTFGIYFTLFISLPLAVFSYKVLEPILGRLGRNKVTIRQITDEEAVLPESEEKLSWRWKIAGCLMASVLTLISGYVGLHKFAPIMIAGSALMVLMALSGDLLYTLTRKKIPAVCFVSLIAMLSTSPWSPWAEEVLKLTNSINTLSLITPMLTFAGLSIAKDLPAFRKLGWRIVIVSLVSNLGTFFGAALIAELFH